MQKLIIWDFDGVISDSEELWIKNWQELLNEKLNIGWDFAKAEKELGGLSPRNKIDVLQQMGIIIDEPFLADLKKRDWEVIRTQLTLTPGVKKILDNQKFRHCLATNGNLDKTIYKMEILGIKKYFPDEVIFSAQVLKHGKPAPDLFLLTAQKMGFEKSNCIVIEDSLAGLKAGLSAKMTTIAYVGSKMNNNDTYLQKVRGLDINLIFTSMENIEAYLSTL